MYTSFSELSSRSPSPGDGQAQARGPAGASAGNDSSAASGYTSLTDYRGLLEQGVITEQEYDQLLLVDQQASKLTADLEAQSDRGNSPGAKSVDSEVQLGGF